MIELDLLGVGADGQTLVFTDTNGERYSVVITDELRGSVRRNRPTLESVPTPGEAPLRPKDIQALLRSGATIADIARDHGLEPSHVARFESPVTAEKNYALARAQEARIGGDPDSPIMGDMVLDRLAARGVDAASLEWSARRTGTEPWEICLTFIQGASEHAAHWTLTPEGSVEALNQEARWLTETVTHSPSNAVFAPLTPRTTSPFANVEDDGVATFGPAAAGLTGVSVSEVSGLGGVDDAEIISVEDVRSAQDLATRSHLVDQLNAARGKRQPIDIDLDDDEEFNEIEDFNSIIYGGETTEEPAKSFTSSISARIYSLAHLRSKETEEEHEDRIEILTGAIDVSGGSTPTDNLDEADILAQAELEAEDEEIHVDAETSQIDVTDEAIDTYETLPGLGDADGFAPQTSAKPKPKGRRSVPSWDEIVFGSKPNS